MKELLAMIQEIRSIRGIKPGEKSTENADFGEVGQIIESLAFGESLCWEILILEPGLVNRVVEGTKTYLASLKAAATQ